MTWRGSTVRAQRPEWGRLAASGFGALLAWALAALASGVATASESPAAPRPFRLAFTSSMFTEVNENDARAAMKVWIVTASKERGIPVDPDVHIYSSVDALLRANREDPVDGFGLVTPEYVRLSREIRCDRFATSRQEGGITEGYLLLVHRDSGWERLEQLQGRSLNVLQNLRMSLATVWLDTLLLEARLRPTAEFFGRITSLNKASRVALPVFFRQADACLLTRTSFKVLGELNPQVLKQLRVLATSPEVVPSGFAYRADSVSPHRAQMLAEMSRLGDTPAGRQILTLTQADRLEDHPVSCLDSALELLAKHARLCGAADATAVRRDGPAPAEAQRGAR